MGSSAGRPETEPRARAGKREPLEALALALTAAGLPAEVRQEHLGAERKVHVEHDDDPLQISFGHLPASAYEQWFFGPGYKPIGPVGDLEETVAAVMKIFADRTVAAAQSGAVPATSDPSEPGAVIAGDDEPFPLP